MGQVVAAPVVVILAAGQGTRMRSRTPKLLHPICGREMIGWPIAAAREDWKSAYAAWQKLIDLDPRTPGGDARLKELKRKAVGEET